MRAWGRSEALAREAVERVDLQREAFVRGLLEQAGVPRERAASRSRALYLMLIGEFARVAQGAAATQPLVWSEVLRLALSRG
jgi:hypothetical protein